MGSCITMPLPNIPTRIPTYDERKIRVIQTQIRKYLTKKRILASIKTTQQNEDFILIDPTEHDDKMNSDAPTDLPLIKITNAINGQSIKAQAHLSKTCQVQEGHCIQYLESSSDRQKHDRNSSTKRIPTGESGSTYINNNDVGKEITQTQDYQVECAKSQIIGNLIPYEVCIGTEQYPDGSSYQGEFKKGLKWGYGVFKNADGSYYEGQFENDLFHGYGKFVNIQQIQFWPNNSKIYEGFWQYGCKHGQGSLIWKDGKEYKGNYQNDIKNGFGEMRFNDGRIYKGYWLNGLQHGDGLFINPKGVETQGVWKEGRLIKF